MRLSYLILLGALALAACDKPATKIGTTCKSNSDCNVAGQLCVGGICTKTCSGQFDELGCPIGYNCTVSDPVAGLTCNKVPFPVDPMSGAPLLYGKTCATDKTVCDNTGDPNPTPSCRFAEDPRKPGMPATSDANAVCTGPCEKDTDCPFFMACLVDYDGAKKCLLRQRCSDCLYNDNCPANAPACVPSKDGMNNYCTSPCNNDNDCPGAAQGISYMFCIPGLDTNNNAGKFCFHKYGGCVGKGQVCDPCRSKDDCMTGLRCLENDQTGEKFCTKSCADDTACMSPNTTGCNEIATGVKICTGDAGHNTDAITCYP